MTRAAKPKRRGSDDAKHLMRYLRSKANVSIADQAKREGVSARTIMESIDRMAVYEGKNAAGQLTLAINDIVISMASDVKGTLSGLLNATTTFEKKNEKTGKLQYVDVPDKVTRLEALKVYKGLTDSALPKGPAVAVQVNNTNSPSINVGKGETSEERMRRLRSQAAQHNLLPPAVIGVPDVIDQGGSSSDVLDLDDDDEDDDDDA